MLGALATKTERDAQLTKSLGGQYFLVKYTTSCHGCGSRVLKGRVLESLH